MAARVLPRLAGLGVALGCAILVPRFLAAQSARDVVAGVRRPVPSTLVPTGLLTPTDSTASTGTHVLVGIVVGGALGAALGSATADCDTGVFDQLCQGTAALQGALIGAVAGAFIGIFVWQQRQPSAFATPSRFAPR